MRGRCDQGAQVRREKDMWVVSWLRGAGVSSVRHQDRDTAIRLAMRALHKSWPGRGFDDYADITLAVYFTEAFLRVGSRSYKARIHVEDSEAGALRAAVHLSPEAVKDMAGKTLSWEIKARGKEPYKFEHEIVDRPGFYMPVNRQDRGGALRALLDGGSTVLRGSVRDGTAALLDLGGGALTALKARDSLTTPPAFGRVFDTPPELAGVTAAVTVRKTGDIVGCVTPDWLAVHLSPAAPGLQDVTLALDHKAQMMPYLVDGEPGGCAVVRASCPARAEKSGCFSAKAMLSFTRHDQTWSRVKDSGVLLDREDKFAGMFKILDDTVIAHVGFSGKVPLSGVIKERVIGLITKES